MQSKKPIEICLAGELQLLVNGQAVELPPSRKARALLTYLALENRQIGRSELCDIFWGDSDNPRAALRWSLSKLRSSASEAGGQLLQIASDTVAVDSSLVFVDVNRLRTLLGMAPEQVQKNELLALESRFSVDLLSGISDAGGPVFSLWLESTRVSLQQLHSRLVTRLLARDDLVPEQRLELAGRSVSLDPLGDAANIAYLRELVTLRGMRAGRKALQAIRNTYALEKQSDHAVVSAWQGWGGGAAVSVDRDLPGEQEGEGEYRLPEKPSIAVLDFETFGFHDGSNVLARGLTVDLNSRLSRLPHLFVIARASASRLSGQELPLRELATRLGVRYLLFGSAQRADRRVRITVNLVDAVSDNEIWSEHYDRQLDDLFEIQDAITGAVIAAIEPAIELAEARRALMKQPESLNAWEYFHRGLWHCYHFLPVENETASELFARAIQLDPHFSRAYAGLSFTHFSRAFLNSAADVDEEIAQAVRTGQASVGLDPRDAMAHWSLGRALFLGRQHEQALACVDQALGINPNYAQGHYARGFIGIHSGEDETSLPFLDSAQRLSPFDPLLFAMKSSRGISLAQQGKFDEAANWALRATHEPNAHFHIYAIAAACLQLVGRNREARERAGWVLDRRPDFSIDVFKRSFPHRDESQRQHLIDALQQAGIPRSH